MDGIKNLLNSKKAIAGGLLVVASTIFVLVGRMTVTEWKDFNTWVFGIYASAETVNGVGAMVTNQKKEEAAAAVVAAGGEK